MRGTRRGLETSRFPVSIVGVDTVEIKTVEIDAGPISWVSFACEQQRDWARSETVADVVEIVLTERLLKE